MLTKKEIKILELKKKGFKQIEIASKLRISQPAVSGFYNNAVKKIKESYETVKIAKKMGVKSE